MTIADLVKDLKKNKMIVKAECKPCGMHQTYLDVPKRAKDKAKEFTRQHLGHKKSKWNKFLESFFGFFGRMIEYISRGFIK